MSTRTFRSSQSRASLWWVALASGLLAFAILGCSGKDGANGKDGTNGSNGTNGTSGNNGVSCKVTDNGNGTSTITCTDGTTATVSNGSNGTNGDAGANGTSCTVTNNGNGTATISCTDGTSATVANGDAGADGQSCVVVDNGNGTRTITCANGTSVTVYDAVIDYAVMTAQERRDAAFAAVLTGVTIPADGRPEVTLKVSERHGLGVKNLSATAVSWRFAILKLQPATAAMASELWVNYIANNSTSTSGTENATATTLTDNGDGTYLFKFAKQITAGPNDAGTTYDAAAVHRLVVLLYATGTPFSPINLVRDWVPAGLPDGGSIVTGQHEKVDQTACLECHTRFQALADETGVLGSGEFHGGTRYDVRTCVACHNDQRRFTPLTGGTVDDSAIAADGTWTGKLAVVNGQAVLDLPVYIHKIHMGEDLTLKGGTYVGVPTPYETTFPQDIRNCVKCHRAPAPLADNYKNVTSRRACGSCHDNVSFLATVPPGRVAHAGGAQADDSLCGACHSTGGLAKDVPTNHQPVSLPNPNNIYLNPTSGNANTNAASVAAANFVPKGAKVITYDLQSASVVAGNPQIVFRFMIADPTATPPGAPVPVVFQTFQAGVTTEMIPGFVGSPSAYFVYALPQDGVAAPADFNASASGYLRNIWNGSATGSGAGTLTGPDVNGYYTVKLTGVTLPASATMVTAGLGYTYSLGSAPTFSNNTQPFTEIDLAGYPYTPNGSGFAGSGGLIVPPPDVWKVATGYTGRRLVVSNAQCDNCHVALGVGPDFHAGQRNDASSCNFCHRPNQTSSGWGANQKDFIHGIHAAAKRQTPFTWHAASATQGYWDVTFPAVLNECDACHLPNTYDFSLASTSTAQPNMLYSTVGQGRYNSSAASNPTGYWSISPYVTSNLSVDYGYGFSTSNVSASLPDGISGTQGGNTCSVATPCICTAANPCSVTLVGPYTVNNVAVSFTQKIGAVTTPCNSTTSCTCTNSQPCTGVVATCSLTTPCDAQGTTLVNSPIAAACSACHDSAVAVDHMQTNGASFYEARSIALTKPQKEECLICHGPNRIAAISLVHTDKTP